MTPDTKGLLLALANLAVCVLILGICACRTVPMHRRTTRTIVRTAYAVVGVGAMSSGISWWAWGELPGWGTLLSNLGPLYLLLSTSRLWRGPDGKPCLPPHALTMPDDFNERPMARPWDGKERRRAPTWKTLVLRLLRRKD